jgi:hypothetical protein
MAPCLSSATSEHPQAKAPSLCMLQHTPARICPSAYRRAHPPPTPTAAAPLTPRCAANSCMSRTQRVNSARLQRVNHHAAGPTTLYLSTQCGPLDCPIRAPSPYSATAISANEICLQTAYTFRKPGPCRSTHQNCPTLPATRPSAEACEGRLMQRLWSSTAHSAMIVAIATSRTLQRQ